MRQCVFLATAFIGAPLVNAQVINFCKDDACGDCPSGLTTAGSDVKGDCVIYDTKTVFGGQGFEELDNPYLFEAYAKYYDACGGLPGALMIRSPATLTHEYCGDLVKYSTEPQCGASKVELQETFMVQFCCGSGDCEAAGVPWGRRRSLGNRTPGGPTEGQYLSFANGTTIEPLVVGRPSASPKNQKRKECQHGWLANSFVPDGDSYLATFETQAISAVLVNDQDEPTTLHKMYDQSVTTTTGFDVSIGDPFGIISVGASFEFSSSNSSGVQYDIVVPAHESGFAGFTPVYKCIKGTIKTCEGEEQPESESCTPHVVSGTVQGDIRLVQS
ncbi:hypothetical protein F5Y07DRAFT_411098 [Xylaria sp. FL0933]|nr:hypothetical protein F5Y07DRAFT_411098 [Xylaria sp. FL0933]